MKYREGMTRDELEALVRELTVDLQDANADLKLAEARASEAERLVENTYLDAIRCEARDCGCWERILKRINPELKL